jgi:hypothetical protein
MVEFAEDSRNDCDIARSGGGVAHLDENGMHVPNVPGNGESTNLGVDDRAEAFLADFFPALPTWRGKVQAIARLVGLFVKFEIIARVGVIDRSSSDVFRRLNAILYAFRLRTVIAYLEPGGAVM